MNYKIFPKLVNVIFPFLVKVRLPLSQVAASILKKDMNFDENDKEFIFHLLNDDCTLKPIETTDFLDKKMVPRAYQKQIFDVFNNRDSRQKIDDYLYAINGLLELYRGINDRIKNSFKIFCLSDGDDIEGMWEAFSKGEEGFCIVYEINPNDWIGQHTLLNLYPVYYGEKELIKIFDLICKGFESQQTTNGMTDEYYRKVFISTLTKNINFSYQNEWRIIYDDSIDSNLYSFTFAKEIVLGALINSRNKSRLLKIAKEKKLIVRERYLEPTHSKIKTRLIMV